MAPDTERAWAAGFFDGEGSVGFSPYSSGGRKYHRPSVQVSQNHRAPLDRFQAAVGGIGKVYGPYGPYKNQASTNPFWKYHATGRTVTAAIFDALGPFLDSVKYAGFEDALAGKSLTRTERDPETGRFVSVPLEEAS